MIRQLFSVRDNKGEVFGPPMMCPNKAAAIRSFEQAVRSVGTDDLINKYPKDFDLYHLGSFNENTGLYDTGTPVHVCNGGDLVVVPGLN